VFFTQALVIAAEDVKRTEAFARMASSTPAPARFTLAYVPRVWWKNVFDASSRRRSGGHKGPILAFSSLAAGISILVISTFSSSVLTTKEILLRDNVQLQRHATKDNNTITLAPRRNTYFHTISGFLYNASTSIWVSDSYVILPFSPLADQDRTESFPDGVLEAQTMVMQLESSCLPMTMIEKTALNVSYSRAGHYSCDKDCVVASKGFKLRSEDGCEVQLQTRVAADEYISPGGGVTMYEDTLETYGGLFWTNMSSSYISWQNLVQEYGSTPPIESSGERTLKQWGRVFIYGLSDQCHGRDLLLVTPPWKSRSVPYNISNTEYQKAYWNNFTASAEICAPTYYEADMPVTVSTTKGVSSVLFDASAFATQRRAVPKTMLDFDYLDDLSFRGSWSKYMTVPARLGDDAEAFEGVSMLLGEHYALNLTSMIANKTLAPDASRLRSRFFGELVLSSFTDMDTPVFQNVTGKFTLAAKRIMVVTEVAITLAVLFCLATCYALGLIWSICTGRRPLHLKTDPSTAVGSMSLLNLNSKLASQMRAFDRDQHRSIGDMLESSTYKVRAGAITEVDQNDAKACADPSAMPAKKRWPWAAPKGERKTSPKCWKPGMLRNRWLAVLLIILVALAVTLLVLRKYAHQQRLYRTAFVYQVELGLFNTTFSPHSLIAAMIAVAIGLFWDGLDKPMRKLQPYLSMSKRPSAAERGVSLSYETTYWFWAAARAVRRKHWILCLVTVGTTLTQICKSP
jgi:hypothetical protein